MESPQRSSGEKRVVEYLRAAGLQFKEQVSFPELKSALNRSLRFDFLVHANKVDILMEFQGPQHYALSTVHQTPPHTAPVA